MAPAPAQEPAAPQVLCLGEALVDRLGPPGADPAADSVACDDRLGGAPANVACALARLGTPSAMLARLGCDDIGAAFQAVFAQRGVDTSALQSDPLRPSRIVLVQRDAAGERRFGGFSGDRGEGFADQALSAVELSATLAPLLEQVGWLLVGTIPLASPSSAEALQLAVAQARAAGVAVAVDVNWRPTFWNPAADPASGPSPAQILAMMPLLEQAALIKCASEEALWLFGTADPEALSSALPQRPAVVVSDGAAPLHWWLAGEGGSLPAFAVPVVDTTGAGDAFTAGLLHGLLQRPGLLATEARPEAAAADSVPSLMRFASACGALVCQGAGAIDPQPSVAEVVAFLAARKRAPL
ncbi:MAG: carbohydrate kinase [Synechococcaceae cyanobacterium]|nr:carbohydrate kinase [Synechococcaceae cyanobacterium]